MAEQAGAQPTTISLQLVIEAMVQRAYHELCMLAEILPDKSDAERKSELMKFVFETRSRFVRLLVVIKWVRTDDALTDTKALAGSLETRSSLFLQAADALYKQAIELERARLPMYAIPNAVDVLVGGTFSRLPTMIKECVAPEAAVGEAEMDSALSWVEHKLRARLTHTRLPDHVSKRIEDGRLWITTNKLFEISVTLSGPADGAPWRLLSVDILVEDPSLVHSKAATSDTRLVTLDQIAGIHQRLAQRLENPAIEDPLLYACNMTRVLALTLQLNVLRSQAERLQLGQWHGSVQAVVQPSVGELKLQYWRKRAHADSDGQESHAELSITLERLEEGGEIVVSHSPPLVDPETKLLVPLSLPAELDVASLVSRVQALHTHMRLHAFLAVMGAHEGYQAAAAKGVFSASLKGSENGNGFVDIEISGFPRLATGRESASIQLSVNSVSGRLVLQSANVDPSTWQYAQRALHVDVQAGIAALCGLSQKITTQDLAQGAENMGVHLLQTLPLLSDPSQAEAADTQTMYLRFPNFADFYLRICLSKDLELRFVMVKAVPVDQLSHWLTVISATELAPQPRGGCPLSSAVRLCREQIPIMSLTAQYEAANLAHAATGREPGSEHGALPSWLPSPSRVALYNLPRTLCIASSGPCLADFVSSCTVELRPQECVFRILFDSTGDLWAQSFDTRDEQQHTQFDSGSRTLSMMFQRRVVGCITGFLVHWHSALHMYMLWQQLNALIPKLLPEGWLECRWRFSSLVLAYGPDKLDMVHISWLHEGQLFDVQASSQRSCGNPHDAIRSWLCELLNPMLQLGAFLTALHSSFEPLRVLAENSIVEDLKYRVASGILASSVCLHPRSCLRARVVFAGAHGLDLGFTPTRVRIRDAASSVFSGPNEQPAGAEPAGAVLQPIEGCALLLEAASQSTADEVEQCESGWTSLTLAAFEALFRVDASHTSWAQQYIASTVMFNHFVATVKSLPNILEKLPKAAEPASHLSIRFQLKRTRNVTIYVEHCHRLRILVDSAEDPFLSPAQTDVLSKTFEQRILQRPHHMGTALAFVHLLNAPFQSFEAILKVMALDLEAPAASGSQYLQLVVPHHIPSLDNTPGDNGLILDPMTWGDNTMVPMLYFIVRVPARHAGASQRTIDIPLCFDPNQNITKCWGRPGTQQTEYTAQVSQLMRHADAQKYNPNLFWAVQQLLEPW